jgi:hypothetical protein
MMPERSKQSGFWHTFPGVLTAVAAVITAITGLVVVLRQDDIHPPDAVAPRQIVPPENRSIPPSSEPGNRAPAPHSAMQGVVVIFRNGDTQPLTEAVFEPGMKICTRGQDVIEAIKSSGAVPILLTDSESEEALRRGICDARTTTP